MRKAAFSIGQIVHHKLFGYRGVIFDVDPQFLGTDEWYETVAGSRPPRNRPWYHVLVDGQPAQTYVAERNLEPDESREPVEHPLLDHYFKTLENGVYSLRASGN
ncbi:MAG: heat shock protein HspQ [Candidatus Binatia bacterium]